MAVQLREPEEYARALLRHFKIERIGNLSDFASKLGLTIEFVDSKSFDGALVRIPRKLKGTIAVRQTIREDGQKNFTIAHEIGHFVLPGHGLPLCHCTASDINSWAAHIAKQKELAASRFAAEILMPIHTIYETVKRKKATITLASELAGEFNTSLTTSVRKVVDATEEKCAVVCSVNNEIKWVHRNDQFWCFVGPGRLSTDTLAGRLFVDQQEREVRAEIQADSWLTNEKMKGRSVWEDSIYLPYYNAVLTILTLDD